jgi:hypothetical protein
MMEGWREQEEGGREGGRNVMMCEEISEQTIEKVLSTKKVARRNI